MRQRKMEKLLLEAAAALNNFKRAQESENQILKEWAERAEERKAQEEEAKALIESINNTLDKMEKNLNSMDYNLNQINEQLDKEMDRFIEIWGGKEKEEKENETDCR